MKNFDSDVLFSNAFQHSAIGMALVGLDGRWLKVNHALCELIGYAEEELLQVTFKDITHPDDLESDLSHVNELIQGKKSSYQMVKRYFHKDGSIITVLLTASIVCDEDHHPLFFISQIQDITEQKKVESELKLFAKVLETTQQGVIIADADEKITYVNEGFTKITGYSFEEVKGQHLKLLPSGDHDESFLREMWMNLLTNGYWEGVISNKDKFGNTYTQWLNIGTLKDETNKTTHYIAVFSDVSKLKKAKNKLKEINKQLNQLSAIDELTGIPNRRTFDEKLSAELKKATQWHKPLSVVLLDVDFFKTYNDTYGHLKGDTCLRTAAAAMEKKVAEFSGILARYGGEEFIAILPDMPPKESCIAAEEIRKSVEKLKIPHGKSKAGEFVTTSAGLITVLPGKHHYAPDDLIHLADQALYEAKEAGRNQLRVAKGSDIF
ncbi:diguanylate cyclase [Bacillus badius]|uniref:diguanylate cyclase domain-containing protein n=1 Tax=Bacillus badius TaxID=1455 RepID=UPI001CBD719F|nr:diguanylate cyclase [Bacillus badius]UAT29175.1 diguanylate cyclase [Bacillus badius]